MKSKIIFLIALVVFFKPVRAFGSEEGCIGTRDHDAVTLLLIDRSGSTPFEGQFKQTFTAIKKMLQPNERLVTLMIADKLSTSKLMIDVVNPKSSLLKSKLQLRKEKIHYEKCLNQLEGILQEKTPSFKTTAILETLTFANEILRTDNSSKKRLIVYSDMVQNSQTVTFYNGNPIEGEKVLKKLKQQSLLRSFPGVEFYFTGVGSSVNDEVGRKIESFWRSYVESTKGEVKFYGPVLVSH